MFSQLLKSLTFCIDIIHCVLYLRFFNEIQSCGRLEFSYCEDYTICATLFNAITRLNLIGELNILYIEGLQLSFVLLCKNKIT